MDTLQAQTNMIWFIEKYKNKYSDIRKEKWTYASYSHTMYNLIQNCLWVTPDQFWDRATSRILFHYELSQRRSEDNLKIYKVSEELALDIFYNLQNIKQSYHIIANNKYSNIQNKEIYDAFRPMIYKGWSLQLQYTSWLEYVLENHNKLLESLGNSISGLELTWDNKQRLSKVWDDIEQNHTK